MGTSEQEQTPAAMDALAAIRRDIDRIDVELIELIDRRMELAEATVEVKRRAGVGATDGRREAEVVRTAASRARAHGIEPELVREIFWRLIELSRTASRHGRVQAGGGQPGDARSGRLVDPYDVPAPPREAPGDAPDVDRPVPERRRDEQPLREDVGPGRTASPRRDSARRRKAG